MTLHPQTDLPTRRTPRNPIPTAMKNSHRRHSRNALPAQLRQLIPLPAIDIHKPIHVSDAEALDMRLRVQLPLGAETVTTLPLAYKSQK